MNEKKEKKINKNITICVVAVLIISLPLLIYISQNETLSGTYSGAYLGGMFDCDTVIMSFNGNSFSAKLMLPGRTLVIKGRYKILIDGDKRGIRFTPNKDAETNLRDIRSSISMSSRAQLFNTDLKLEIARDESITIADMKLKKVKN